MGANSLKVVEPIFDECGSAMGNLLKHQLTPFSLSRPNVTKRDNAEGTLSDKGHNDRLQVLPPRSARASEDERTVIRRA
jgi:hypothetical protein